MPTPTLSFLDPNADVSAIRNYLIKLQRDLSFLMENMDTQNIFEVGGWRVKPTQLASKDQDVGMSTEDTESDDIRFWAGDVKTGDPKFIVTKSGVLYAKDGNFTGNITGSKITGSLIRTSAEEDAYPRIELSDTTNILTAYVDADNYIQIVPDTLGGAQIKFHNNGNEVTQKLFNSGIGGYVYMIQSDGDIQLNSTNDIVSNPTRYHRFSSWSKIYSTGEGSTLLAELNNIKSRLSSLESRVTTLEATP